MNEFDELFRTDMQNTQKNIMNFLTLTKKLKLLNNEKIKKIVHIITNIIT